MMGKQSAKKKKQAGTKSGNTSAKENKVRNNSRKPYDEDTAVFISMSGELKDEGNKLFQKRDYEGAMLKYEKAIKLLPRNHIDVSYLRSNMAACYMQMGISEYPRAIHECNLALEVTPKYSKALLKRARCYEALNRLDFALRDVSMVLKMEPNNIMAAEIAERVGTTIERRSIKANEIQIDSVPEYIEPPCTSHPPKALKENPRKKKNKKFDRAENKTEEKKVEDRVEESVEGQTNEKKAKDKFAEKEEVQTDNKKAEEIVENNKAKGENKAEDELAEDKVEEQKAEERTDENKAEDKLAEDIVDEKKAEERIDKAEDKDQVELAKDKVEEQKAEERTDEHEAEDELVDDKVEEQKEDERTDENKAEDELAKNRVEEQKAEERTDENKAEDRLAQDVVEEKKAEEKTDKRKDKDQIEEKNSEEKTHEKKAEDKVVVEEKISTLIEEKPKRTVKLVFGEDIRWAQLPFNCTTLKLREVICDRFPSSEAVLVKYRDQEGDLVTITTNEELRWAEASAEQQGSVRLYVVEVNPEQDPFYNKVKREKEVHKPNIKHSSITENGSMEKGNKTEMGSSCIDDWVIQFAHLFKNYVGFSSDAYLDLHDMGMKLYSEALEETVTSEEAQDLFQTAAENFLEMAALALFNCGNVHMSRARKRVCFTEDASTESILAQIATAYHWAQEEFLKAGNRYEEALKIKPDFFEAVLALGQQQFEQGKLSWYYAVGSNVDLETWPTAAVLQLYNNAEDNMERGMQMWEEAEEQRLNELSKPNKVKTLLKTFGLDGLYKDISADEAAEQAANMRSQINLLWGTMLYERSAMEFKLGLPVWHECLEIAVEKFELAGASPTDIAVMIKNHCSNDNSLQGLGFNIDEIVQAWNEMYEAKRWQSGVPSFRLEPLLRRRVSKLYYALVHA